MVVNSYSTVTIIALLQASFVRVCRLSACLRACLRPAHRQATHRQAGSRPAHRSPLASNRRTASARSASVSGSRASMVNASAKCSPAGPAGPPAVSASPAPTASACAESVDLVQALVQAPAPTSVTPCGCATSVRCSRPFSRRSWVRVLAPSVAHALAPLRVEPQEKAVSAILAGSVFLTAHRCHRAARRCRPRAWPGCARQPPCPWPGSMLPAPCRCDRTGLQCTAREASV